MRSAANKRETFFKDGSYDGFKSDKIDSILSSKLGEMDGLGGVNGSSSSVLGMKSSALSSSLSSTKYSNGSSHGEFPVGYASLPNQAYRKAVRRGFEFNLMVVGESGLGKSTFINSLFITDLYNADHLGPSKRLKKTVYVEPHIVILKENNVIMKLTLIDTPGFGDAVDNTNCWQPVIDDINTRFEEYLSNESRVNRTSFSDRRIHACLYFIPPTGHGLRPLDIEFMRRIMDKVNLIPVIAKADSMTVDECRDFKKTIWNELLQSKIKIYDFPENDGCLTGIDDETELTKYRRLKERIPFAIVGANTVLDKGNKVRGRTYPWGAVEVDNLEHNDFVALRNLMIKTHMQDLKDVTSHILYENYRHAKLSGIAQEGKFQTKDGKDPMTQMESEKKEHENKMKKMEADMEQVFEQKVKEKKQKLKESEQDLQRRAEQMKKQLEQQEQELQEKWKQYEAEKAVWEESNKDAERRRSLENISGGDAKEKTKTKKKGLF